MSSENGEHGVIHGPAPGKDLRSKRDKVKERRAGERRLFPRAPDSQLQTPVRILSIVNIASERDNVRIWLSGSERLRRSSSAMAQQTPLASDTAE